MVLDGSSQPEGIATSSGLCAPLVPSSSSATTSQPALEAPAADAGPSGSTDGFLSLQAPVANGGAGISGHDSAGDGELASEVERLRAELAAAQNAAQQWKAMHSELNKFVIEKLVPGASNTLQR